MELNEQEIEFLESTLSEIMTGESDAFHKAIATQLYKKVEDYKLENY